MPERIDQVVRDLENQGKTISTVILDQRQMKDELVTFRDNASRELTAIDKREAVRAERDKHLDERLDRIENSIRAVYGLGRWVLAAFGASAIALVANFVVRGGMFLG
jgi:hypothetical protein